MIKHTLITLLSIALMLSASVFAQSNDRNGDGMRASQADDRKRDGRDNNGEMSRRVMRVIDTNGDRQVSIEEYMAYAQQRFADADTNGDNFISREEGRAASESMREEQDKVRSLLKDKSNDDSE